MAKTPPLVIPVVVDASGVNSGLSNINRRLSGARGNAGSDNGNFGSGGNGAIALGAAAGLAAGGAARLGRGFNPNIGAGSGAWMAHANISARERQQFYKMTLAQKAKAHAQGMTFGSMASPPRWQGEWMLRQGARIMDASANLNFPEGWQPYADSMRRHAQDVRNKADAMRERTQRMLAAVGRGRRYYNAGRAFGRLGPLGVGAAAALGVGSIAATATTLLGGARSYGRNLENDNLQELVGSPNYGVLRRAQLREFARYRGQGTLAQNFMLGAESGWGISEGGGVGNISYGMNYGMNEISKGLGRMASRPISGTIENIIRILTWSATRTAPSTEVGDATSEKFYRWLGME